MIHPTSSNSLIPPNEMRFDVRDTIAMFHDLCSRVKDRCIMRRYGQRRIKVSHMIAMCLPHDCYVPTS